MFNLLRLQLGLQPRTLHLQRLVPMQGQHVEGRRHQNIAKVTTQKHLIMSFSYDAMVGGTSNGYQNNALQRLCLPVEFSQQQLCLHAQLSTYRAHLGDNRQIQFALTLPLHFQAIKLTTRKKQTSSFQLKYFTSPGNLVRNTQYCIFCPAPCQNSSASTQFMKRFFKEDISNGSVLAY